MCWAARAGVTRNRERRGTLSHALTECASQLCLYFGWDRKDVKRSLKVFHEQDTGTRDIMTHRSVKCSMRGGT